MRFVEDYDSERKRFCLARSGITVTTFKLMDTQTEDYRWARGEVGIREIVTKFKLKNASRCSPPDSQSSLTKTIRSNC